MKDQREQWSVRKCSAVCAGSGKAFEEGDEVVSSLQFDEGAYQRVDRLASCTEAAVEGISVWRTRYAVPPAPEEVGQKENVEGLLRKRMASKPPKRFYATKDTNNIEFATTTTSVELRLIPPILSGYSPTAIPSFPH